MMKLFRQKRILQTIKKINFITLISSHKMVIRACTMAIFIATNTKPLLGSKRGLG